LGVRVSKSRVFNNGLSQRFVLAPTLFNIYIHDPISKKFVYVDDICIATQCKDNEIIEHTIEEDLNVLENYFKMWRLKPNPSKIAISLIHFNNRTANQELKVNFCGHQIKHDKFPVYLGIILGRTLTYKNHTENTASKLKTRTALISKLAGTTWEANTQVLRISTLALLYSVAEYCSPIWEGSTHCRLIDIELRIGLRKITETVKSTKLQWLPVLANIEPAHIRRQNSVLLITDKIHNPVLPIHEDGIAMPKPSPTNLFLQDYK